MNRAPGIGAAVVALVASLGTVGCAPTGSSEPVPTPVDSEPWPDVDLDLLVDVRDSSTGTEPSFVADPPTVLVSASTAGGGRVRRVSGPAGTAAVAFPDHQEASRGALAALLVTIKPKSTVFSPDAEEFQFGLDVYLPETPRITPGDDGDNLIQRGYYGQGQLKLQVDAGVPSCRIAGDDGEALVKGSRLAVGQWYRLRCQRTDDRVSLFVGRVNERDEVARWERASLEMATGLIDFGEVPAPVSVGGKLNPKGQVIPDSPDQFNGAVTHIVYDLH